MRNTLTTLALACFAIDAASQCPAAMADEHPTAIATLQASPATALDVLMLAAIDEINDSTQIDTASFLAGGNSLLLTRHTAHTVPQWHINRWEIDSALVFGNFVYHRKTNRFVAHFILSVPDAHIIWARDLSQEANKVRALIMQEELAKAVRNVALGIEAATYRVSSLRDDIKLRESVLKEVKANTTVVLHWKIGPINKDALEANRTAELLQQQGVAVRTYTAKSGLNSGSPAEKYAVEVVCHDCDSEEAAEIVFLEQLDKSSK